MLEHGKNTVVWLMAVVLLAGWQFGCDHREVEETGHDEIEFELSDKEITAVVEDEFYLDPVVPLNDIDVQTTEGIVQLGGQVDNLLAKERAVRIAETVRGVRSVVDQILVEPFWKLTDRDVEKDAQEALLRDAATDSWEIVVEVEDKVATLTGSVDSLQEKKLAGTVVKGVKGVRGVENRIGVEYPEERSDTEILADVEEKLRWDVLVDHALVVVDVEDGVVKLSGTVGSAAEKRRACWDAWVNGMQSVSTDGLQVKYWERDERLRKEKYVQRDDPEVEQAIDDALFYDPRVLAGSVEADVDNGFVVLRGEVDNLAAKRAAGQDARNTVGVVSVKNRLRVRFTEPEAEEIAERIRAAFGRDPFVERYKIDVEFTDGTARLTGRVDSYFEKGRADDLASRIYGVKEVDNDLVVDEDAGPLVYSPFLLPLDPHAYTWYGFKPRRTQGKDARIRDKIEKEIWWSPYLDVDNVCIEVVEGVATLTGEVKTPLSKIEATEEALEGGAVWVENDLRVASP